MTSNSIVILFVHTLFAAVFVYSLWYDTFIIIDPRKVFAGKWKFLTYWTMIAATVYWVVAVLNGLSKLLSRRHDGVMQRLVDDLHACVAFPLGLSVCVIFWLIYAIDRELIYPRSLDAFIPYWMNHVMHTLHIPFLLVDKYLVLHTYPKQSRGIMQLLVIPTFYQIWLLYLGLEKGIWVYPILQQMNWPFRIAFIALIWVAYVLLYKLGDMLTRKIWGGYRHVPKQKVR